MFNFIAAKSSHLRHSNIVGQYGRRRHHQCNECAAHILCASSAQQRSQHSAQAEFGKAGGAAEDCRPQSAKHVPTCGLRAGAEPGAPSEARLRTFLSKARGSGRCGSGDWSGLTTPCMRQRAMGAKRYVAALLRRPPQDRFRSSIRSGWKRPRSRALARVAQQRGVLTEKIAQPVRAEDSDPRSAMRFVHRETEQEHKKGQNDDRDIPRNGR